MPADHDPYYVDPDGTTGPLTVADMRNRLQWWGMWDEADWLVQDEFKRKDTQ